MEQRLPRAIPVEIPEEQRERFALPRRGVDEGIRRRAFALPMLPNPTSPSTLPCSVSMSNGSQRLAYRGDCKRDAFLAKKSMPSSANSASAGLNTSRVFVSTLG